MVRHVTILENRTDSPFEVKSESSSGVHSLLTILGPGDTYNLVIGSGDTYLQHWVIMGNAPVVCFSSDDLFDNEKIEIVQDGPARYRMIVKTRHGSSRPPNSIIDSDSRSNGQTSQSVGGASATQIGRPPRSGLKRFFTDTFSFIRRSPEPALRSANSAPVPDSDVTSL